MSSEFWRGHGVFVTGGTGFVGAWLVRTLLSHGARVTMLVRSSSGHGSDVVPLGCKAVHGDLQDGLFLQRTLTELQPETVFHLGGQSQVREAHSFPVDTLEANVQGTWNMLDACRKTGVSRVVLSSSGQVYGVKSPLPHHEASPLLASHPYEASKQCVELLARMYAHTYDLPIGMIRSCNLFGGGDLNFARMIPGVIRETYFGRRFTICGDGRSIRDYLYVEDAVAAYLLLAEALHNDRSLGGEAFNISLPVRLRVIDLVHCILHIMHREDLAPIILNATVNETKEQCLLSEKACERLGWQPRTSMEEGLAMTVDWYSRYFRSSTDHELYCPVPAANTTTRSTYEDSGLPRRLAL